MRFLLPVSLLLIAGCAPTPSDPVLREIEPATLTSAGGPIELRGEGFLPMGALDFDRPTASPLSTTVSAELVQGDQRVPMSEVTLLDSTRVSAVVPAGLAPGRWSVHLITPRGVELVLSDALLLEAAVIDGGPDAGPDAGDPDAGDPDAGDRDAGEDAGFDAGPEPCDASTFFDDDGDGFGVPDSGAFLCGPGRVFVEGDCNDVDALTSPSGLELCNQLDDDCDGTVDEGCADAGFVLVRDGGNIGYRSASAWASDCLWIAASSRLVVLDGDAGVIDSSANCPSNMNTVWAMPSGRAFVAGGNNGVGRITTASSASGCQPTQLIPEPVVGMVGFASSDGGVRLEAVLRDGRHLSWDGTPGTVQLSGARLPAGYELFDAHGSSPDALYAVGGTIAGPQRPAVFRLYPDGRFVLETLPPQGVQDGQLHGVWVLSPDEVVAVGDRGLVLRKVHGAWERIAPPNTANYTTVRAFSIGRFYLSSELGSLRQWSGKWSLQDTDPVPVRDLTAFDEEHLWLVGDGEVIIKGPNTTAP